jgi:hypothetical protein
MELGAGINQPIPGEIANGREIGLRPQVKYVWAICPDCPPEKAGRWICYRLDREFTRRCLHCSSRQTALTLKANYIKDPEATRQKAVSIRQSDPRLSAAAIAAQLGVSRSRIGQIFQEENLPKPRKFISCQECGAPFTTGRRHHGAKFCSKECWLKFHHVTVTCAQCGQDKVLKRSEWKARLRHAKHPGRFFCNHRCAAIYTGLHWGFGNRKKDNGAGSGGERAVTPS